MRAILLIAIVVLTGCGGTDPLAPSHDAGTTDAGGDNWIYCPDADGGGVIAFGAREPIHCVGN